MNFLEAYIQPLTYWLQAHPYYSLLFTFLISLTESLAIIGSIIPGSVTMTAIGILAGSGFIRLDLTLIAAILGAICGDSLSYALGLFYSERLVEIWPFNRYPQWFTLGKDFFARHGGKSVLIGRFIGPLRSLIPVIAGIVHMKKWHFFLANSLSAIGWALVYIMPGVLIGAASNKLSAESATKLVLILLIILIIIWLASVIIKWLLIKLNSLLKNNSHKLWIKLKENPYTKFIYYAITPARENYHYPTACLFLVTFFNIILLIGISLAILWNISLANLDKPIYLFLQSIHTFILNSFFIVCAQLTSTITIVILYLMCFGWFVYYRNLKILLYFTSIIATSILFAFILNLFVTASKVLGMLSIVPALLFLNTHLVIATAFYSFILFAMYDKNLLVTNLFKIFILIALGLSGVGSLYLGDIWFTHLLASYIAGIIICLIHYLIYRKSSSAYLHKTYSFSSFIFFLTLLVAMIATTLLATYLNFDILNRTHQYFYKEYKLTKTSWWNQQNPILPVYRFNRIGTRISILNIQYVGNLEKLKKSLLAKGWQVHKESFLTKLILFANNKKNEVAFPLLEQLYENKSPELIMTYKQQASLSLSPLIVELTMWKSNYKIIGLNQTIWIGTLHQNLHRNKKHTNQFALSSGVDFISYLIPALNQFNLKQIQLPSNIIYPVVFPAKPMVLLIKDSIIDKQDKN